MPKKADYRNAHFLPIPLLNALESKVRRDSRLAGPAQGRIASNEVWWRRHRVILALLGANAAAIAGLGIVNGYGIAHSVAESSLIALVAPRRK